MKKKLFKIFRWLFLAVLTFLQLSILHPQMVCAYTTQAVFDQDTGSLQIHYSDTFDDQERAICGAEFSIYQIGKIDSYGNYKSLISSILNDLSNDQEESIPEGIVDEDNNLQIDKMDEQVITALSNAVTEKYSQSVEEDTVRVGKTDEKGLLCFDNLELGLYLVVETSPAEKHLASQAFLASIPYTEEGQNWQYDLEAEPKSVPCADLKIQKTVTGDGEKERDFHFKISFDSLSQDQTSQIQTWTAIKSDGTSSQIKNGGIVTLQDGQTLTIENIPVGTSYEVTEMEANQGGYTTTMEGNQGNISYTQENLVKFVNHKSTTTKISSATPTSQSGAVKTSDKNNWFVYLGLFLCAAIAGILILKKGRRLLSLLLVIGIGSTLLFGSYINGIHHASVQKTPVSKTENDVQQEDLSVNDLTESSDMIHTSSEIQTQTKISSNDNADENTSTDKNVSNTENVSTTQDRQVETNGILPSGSSAIQIKLSEGGHVTVCDGDDTTYTEEGTSFIETNKSESSAASFEESEESADGLTSAKTSIEESATTSSGTDQSESDTTSSGTDQSELTTDDQSNVEKSSDEIDTSDTVEKNDSDQLMTIYKTDGASTKLLIAADDDYVISSFSHLEDGVEINDGPSAEDLSKNVTMVIPSSETTTYIEVTFVKSQVLTDAEEEQITEEEEELADGDMILVSLINTDSDFAEETMSDQIDLASADEDDTETTTSDETDTNADGQSLLVSDASLPSTVTVYNSGHVINYSHYGGSSSETDLCHIYSSSADDTKRTAYCVEPGKTSPVYDKTSATLQISSIDNANLYKVLYYGYGGPGDITGDITGWTTDDFLIFTRLCVVYAYSGQDQAYTFQSCSDLMVSRTMDLWNAIMRQPDPIDYMKFTPALQTVSADSDTSADITFEASAGNSVDITMPEGVAIYNRTHPEYNWENGNTKIFAGDTFYLVTKNKDYTFNPGILTGNTPSMLMFITESLNNSRQRLVGWIPETLQASFQVHWCDTPEIDKSVDRQSNNVGQKQTWSIEAEIPNEPISSFEITDQLDQRLNYEGNVTVTVEKDKERRSTAYTGSSYIYDGIDWSPVFDPEWYSSYYPDVKEVYGDDIEGMLKHFVTTGIYQWHTRGRLGFDIDVYKNDPSNADLKEAIGDNIYAYYRHFCLYGVHEGRICSELTGAEEESADAAVNSPDYTVSYDETTHMLTVHFEGSDDVLQNHLDKLTIMQNCKIVITFDTSINEQALAGEEIENISLLNVNQSTYESKPVTVYTGAAKVRKTDSQGNSLSGAKFAIWSVEDGKEYPVVLNEDNQPVNYGDEGYSQDLQQMTSVSEQDGVAQFYGLKDGTYIFRELEAPKGYEVNEKESDPVIVKSGTVSETAIPVVEDQKTPGSPSNPITLMTGGPGNKGIKTVASISFIICVLTWGIFRKKFSSNKIRY